MKKSMISIVAGVMAVSAISWAASYELETSVTKTQTSGNAGSATKKIGGDGDFKALYELSFWEDGDHPSHIEARLRHLNTLSTASYLWDGGVYKNDKKTIAFTNTDTFIRGVQVCLSNSGRLKGVRIYGAKLDRAKGTLSNTSGSQSFERPNCNSWQVAHYCPAGKVATKLVIKHDNETPRASAVGLALECRKVVKK